MANNFVCTITVDKARELKALFISSGWKIDKPQYTNFKAKEGKLSCTVYNSGKLVVMGKEFQSVVRDFVALIIPVESPEEVMEAEALEFVPHAGIDESGKGDFFGPLVTACVFVNDETLPKLKAAGVQDSKNIKNDQKIIQIAEDIKRITGTANEVLVLRNEKYNTLYANIGNLNKLLAWCHATVLENVLERVPECKQAISDQFASSKSVVLSALKERGKKIELIQMTKAERDVAVAAASILARARFVEEMKMMSLELQLTTDLPKGVSKRTKEVARQLFLQGNRALLAKYSKEHFKTFEEICSQ